ncbi:MAG TPA: TonB-dependent receptor [Chitinophaga sp.]|uniref:SusC/RagA family TonB-linked outer membrane protein n=1 Tax=Chitinophaga sp. TaxID=1869181 RepID=UPI002DBAB76D|nr:TonB-dependent receptor [Chitinophaga sp.]HEU4551203.1 TonB-dependent receptor [Chitinophaga sp.]
MIKIRTVQLLLGLATLLGVLQPAGAQNRPFTGVVYDNTKAPVIGATVQVKGAATGATTNTTGRFTLQVPPGADTLVISYLGYNTQTVGIAGTDNITVTLMPNTQSLGDVVVIGYGTARKKELTGSIATVTTKDFQTGVITTPEQLIAGKVAGVSVTSNSGSPGAGSVIRIRGGASLNASNDPLIVIDGLPVANTNIYGASNPLSLVNPNDIASFTVLKDAAATAIYGSRASNGVILITTKKGVAGRPQFSFSTQVSVSALAKKADALTAGEFRQLVDSLGTGQVGNVPFKSLMGSANTDWQKEIYQTGVTTDNNLSMSGSLPDMPYRLSFGYLNQDGILKTDNLQRISGGLSLTPMLFNNHLKIDINLKGAVNKTRFANNAAISSAVYFDPTQPVYSAGSPFGGYYEWYAKDPNTGDVTLNKLAPRNPVALLNLYNNRSTVMRSYGNIQFDYKFHFLPDLHANLNLGYDIAKGDGKINVPAYAAQNFLDSGQHNQYANRIQNKVGEFFLNYNKTIPAIKSNFNVTAGYGYYDNLSTNYNYPSFRANGDTIPGSVPTFPMDKPENILISYYGRLIYTLNNRYILAASLRTDGSSRFSPSTRWGTFPSVAFTWRANQEKFLANAKSLSDLKLRLSYGVTGNQDGIYNYAYLGVYSLSDNASAVQFGDKYYNMGSPAAYDAGIKWEQTATYNAGIDYAFLGNRIGGSVDVYYKKTKDLLNTIPIPAGSNFSSTILTNVGNIENKGIEVQVEATPVTNKQFTWYLAFNAAYNNNKITNLTATKDSTYPGSLAGTVQIHSVGYSPYAFYVYHQVYDAAGKPIEGVYADVNHDGVINERDLYRYKSPIPKFIFGFTTEFSYGKWSLRTVLRANTGNYMYNSLATGASKANMFNTLGYLANTLSEITKSNFYYGQQQSDYFVQNASFLKMDNLTLTRDFGNIIGNRVGLRVTAACQNVFTITKYTGIDPEIYGGIDNALYPRPRTFSLGANLQF